MCHVVTAIAIFFVQGGGLVGASGDDDQITGVPLAIFKLSPGITATSHGIACAEAAGES